MMKQIIFISSLLCFGFSAQSQHRYIIGFNTGYGLASWKEHPEQSGSLGNDPLGVTDKETTGGNFFVHAYAQYSFRRLAIGPSFKHYELTFPSSPSFYLSNSSSQVNSLGMKTNYSIRLSKKIQFSPSLDIGWFWFAGNRDKLVQQRIYISPFLELRKNLGRFTILTGIDSDFLFFTYKDNGGPPNFVFKDNGQIISVNLKVGVVLKFI